MHRGVAGSLRWLGTSFLAAAFGVVLALPGQAVTRSFQAPAAGWPDDIRIYSRALGAAEVAALAGEMSQYVYGLDLVSKTSRSTVNDRPSTVYHGYDGLGSVRYLTDGGTGQITDTYTYDAFGILTAQTPGRSVTAKQ